MSTFNISQAEIENGISYIKDTFMKKLIDNGQAIIGEYSKINIALQSQQIDSIIAEQKVKLSELQNSFETVSNTVRNQMQETSTQVGRSTANINSILNN